MKSLLKAVAMIIPLGLGLYITSLDLPTVSAESASSIFDSDEWRIGINVENRLLELGSTHVGETKVGGQMVSVYTDYHLGYRLDLSSSDSRMLGQTYHGEIQSMSNYEVGKDEIDIDTWAFRTSDNGKWSGLGGASGSVEIARDEGIFPASRDVAVSYGVRTGLSTMADDYKVELNYTLTALLPTTAAIKSIMPNMIQIDGDRVIKAEGFGLTSGDNNMVTLGVDFDANGRIDDNEECLLVGSADGFRGEYLVPELPDKTNKGGKYRLLIHDELGDDEDYDSGHEITYYYQPTIEAKDSYMPIKVKSSVDIVDVASTELSAAILTDDGEVYSVGDMPIYYDDTLVFEQTPVPTLVDLPDIHIADHPVNLTGYGNSYLLTTTQGSVYGWGDNSNGQLSDISNQAFISQPKLHSFFFDGRQNADRKVSLLAMGNGFVTAVVEPGPDSLLYSWGRNDRGQGGWNNDRVNSSLSPMPVVENSHYPYVDDEYYVQVDAGNDYLIGLTNRGRVFTWGWHGAARNGELGDGRLGFNTTDIAYRVHEITYDDDINYLRDVDEDADNPIIRIAAGDNFGLALTEGGDLYRWGDSVCQSNNNLACNITDALGLTVDEKIVDIEADGGQAVAWTNLGNVYNVCDHELRKMLSMPDIEGIDLGKSNYLWTKDDHLYQWHGDVLTKLTDVTNELTNPSYALRVEGEHLDVANIWFDGNNDGLNNDQSVIKNCTLTNECYLYISTAGVNSAGDYNLYAETPFGGRAASVVHISQSRTRGLVSDLVKPTITSLVVEGITEMEAIDERPIEPGVINERDESTVNGDALEDSSVDNDETVDSAINTPNETFVENTGDKDDLVNNEDDFDPSQSALLVGDGSSVELVDGGSKGVLDSSGSVNINDNT